MDKHVIIYSTIIVFWWSISGYISKYMLKHFNEIEYYTIKNLFYSGVVFSIIIYSLIYDKTIHKNIVNKFNYKNLHLYGIIFAGVILGTMTIYSYYKMVQKYEISLINPILNGLNNLLILLFGYFLFNEKITNKKCLGTLFIAMGIYLMG